jgi:hypothetical protein
MSAARFDFGSGIARVDSTGAATARRCVQRMGDEKAPAGLPDVVHAEPGVFEHVQRHAPCQIETR